MSRRILGAATVGSLVCVLGASAALAQSTGYYDPPKLVKQGTATSPVSGSGVVEVQVRVNADGTFKVEKIVRSTNHEDDAVAMQMAQTAKYAPATKDGKKITAFYTYKLNFVIHNGSASVAAPSNSLASYETEVRAGKYTAARAGLSTYLQSHPDDPQASALLGVSEYFLNNFADSAAAFDKAGTVPKSYVAVAANAYAKTAQNAISSKNGSVAVAMATKAKQLDPGVATWNLLGNAQVVAGDYTSAVQSFGESRTLAANDSKIDAKERGTIASNLVAAYVSANQIDKAVALLPEVKQDDPSNTMGLSHVVDYYAKKGQASWDAGKYSDAIDWYEKGAALGGPYAHTMYTSEALVYMQMAHPNWDTVKSIADKALALSPDDARANLAAGIALMQQRKYQDAANYLARADRAAKAAGDTDAASKAERALTELAGAGVGPIKQDQDTHPAPGNTGVPAPNST
jgi:TonB family protein